jgi:nitroimidazol reductase NimA-like FMN-containing flavoprotein (pyridoxamine 5'-phosphate oxidase superfamily)
MAEPTGTFLTLLAYLAPIIFLIAVTAAWFRKRARTKRLRASRGARLNTPHEETTVVQMRRRDRCIGETEAVIAILRRERVCRIALAVHDEPYLVTMSYGLSETPSGLSEGPDERDEARPDSGPRIALYLHSAAEGRKLRMAAANPRVCFSVEGEQYVEEHPDACDWTVRYESVVGYGRLSVVADEAERIRGLQLIMRQHGWQPQRDDTLSQQDGARNPDFSREALAQVVVLRLDVDELSGKSNLNRDESE